MPRQDLRPGTAEPVYLIVSRAQVETGDATQPLRWLRSLSSDPRTARAFMGRVSVIVEGYDDDPRELFEIAAARSAGQAVMLALVLLWHVPRVRRRPVLRWPALFVRNNALHAGCCAVFAPVLAGV